MGCWTILRRSFFSLLTLVTVVGLFHQFVGPPWPTRPIVIPSLPADSAAFTVHFTVVNESVLFDMYDATVGCTVLDSLTSRGGQIRGIYISGIQSYIPAGRRATFQCSLNNTDAAIQIVDDDFVKATIVFDSSYSVLGVWPIRFGHGPYTWDATIKPPRWIEGPALEKPTK